MSDSPATSEGASPASNGSANETALRACPFCGGEARVFDSDEYEGEVVIFCGSEECSKVRHIGTLWLKGKEAAVVAWNRRAEPDSVTRSEWIGALAEHMEREEDAALVAAREADRKDDLKEYNKQLATARKWQAAVRKLRSKMESAPIGDGDMR